MIMHGEVIGSMYLKNEGFTQTMEILMLGEKMGSMTCTATNKVFPTNGTLPKFEVAVQGSGTLAGVQIQTMSTYYAEMRAD